MTFSQKYEENALAGRFDEHLFRIKLSKAIVALRTSSFKAYNEVMAFLEEDCADAINEIYRLNDLSIDSDEEYERTISDLELSLESANDTIEHLNDIKRKLESKIENLSQEIIKKNREIQGYIEDLDWTKNNEHNRDN